MILSQYICLLLLTGLTGVLSGFLWLIPNGLMGGVLGICLSGGTIWLGVKQRQQSGELSLRQALGAGFVAGLLAGILMALVSQTLAYHRVVRKGELDFGPPILPFWAPLGLGILYGIAIHWSYYQRRFSTRPRQSAIVYACGTCFLLKTAATFIYLCMTEKHGEHGDILGLLMGAAVLSLLGAVPFAGFWTLVTCWLDPTWACPPQTRNDSKDAPPPIQ